MAIRVIAITEHLADSRSGLGL